MTAVPGAMPWITIAPIISAITGLEGMPRVRSGTNEVWAAALLAASGAATPSTAPWPKLLGRPRDALFQHVGGERAQHGAAARQDAEHGPDPRAAQHGRPGLADLLAGRPQAADGMAHVALDGRAVEIAHDLGNAEQAHGDRDEIDAVVEIPTPKV